MGVEKCPECGGETISDEESGERVCVDCGFVAEEDNKKQTSVSDRSNKTTRKRIKPSEVRDSSESFFGSGEDTDDDQRAPETVSNWEMWYPCPICGSTKLFQIIESHLNVSATENGSYGGEQAGVDEYNYVECEDCGEVLLDEIGKDR